MSLGFLHILKPSPNTTSSREVSRMRQSQKRLPTTWKRHHFVGAVPAQQ